jgi:hypothetical protein
VAIMAVVAVVCAVAVAMVAGNPDCPFAQQTGRPLGSPVFFVLLQSPMSQPKIRAEQTNFVETSNHANVLHVLDSH